VWGVGGGVCVGGVCGGGGCVGGCVWRWSVSGVCV
jgi:hypothetical protein